MPLVSIVGGLTDLIGTYVAQLPRIDTIIMPTAAIFDILKKSFIENSHLIFK